MLAAYERWNHAIQLLIYDLVRNQILISINSCRDQNQGERTMDDFALRQEISEEILKTSGLACQNMVTTEKPGAYCRSVFSTKGRNFGNGIKGFLFLHQVATV